MREDPLWMQGKNALRLVYRRFRFGSRSGLATFLRITFRGRPIPLSVVRAFRHKINLQSVMVSMERVTTRGDALSNESLAAQLKKEEFGLWSLGTATLDHLEQWIHVHKPQTVIELGSGISTVCLGRYLLEASNGDPAPILISIEQDLQHAERTQRLLREHDQSDICHVAHVPVGTVTRLGRETNCYELSVPLLKDLLGDREVDVAIIDGPSGPDGIRWATLPLLLDVLAPNSTIFLDDAFRDAELEIADQWRELQGVDVLGIWLLDKGLLEASFRGAHAASERSPTPATTPPVNASPRAGTQPETS